MAGGNGTGWKIYLTSEQGIGYNTSNLTYEMAGTAPVGARGQALYISVNTFSLFGNWYNINENNNYFQGYSTAGTDANVLLRVTVEPGFYPADFNTEYVSGNANSNSLIDAFNTATAATNTGSGGNLSGLTFRSYDTYFDQCTIRNGMGSNNGSFFFDMNNSPLITEVMGYPQTTQLNISTGDDADSTTATFPYYTTSIFIECPSVSIPSLDSRYNGASTKTLGVMPLNGTIGPIWVYEQPTDFAIKVAQDDIRNLVIILTDDKGRQFPASRQVRYTIELAVELRDDENEHVGGGAYDLNNEFYQEDYPLQPLRNSMPTSRKRVRG